MFVKDVVGKKQITMKKQTNAEQIVLNRMFVGEYLEHNLGHEVINVYESDRDGYFLYLNPLGSYDRKRKGLIKRMVLTQGTSYKDTVEVIGLADGLTDYEQIPQEKEITYGGVALTRLFVHNEQKQKCLVTFRAKRVVRPKQSVYIVFGSASSPLEDRKNTKVIRLDSKAAKSSLKQYFSEDEDGEDYQALLGLFSANTVGKPMPKVDVQALRQPRSRNFFEVCGIDHSELAFSNAFGYFIENYPEMLRDFAAKKGIQIDTRELLVIREKECNIDIFVQTPSHIIVVENKVLSDINGKQAEFKDGKQMSQLTKYATHVDKNYPKLPKVLVVMTPDHNDVELSHYAGGDRYCKVYYSEVRKFLQEHASKVKDHDAFYLKELLSAMEKHSRPYYNEYLEQTERRFYQAIQQKTINQ